MKIALINPAFYDGKEFRNRFDDYLDWIKGGNLYVAPFEPPIGLAFLSAYLKERGHEVTLVDMQGLLMDSTQLSATIASHRPDIVGITAMTPTIPEALQAAAISCMAADCSSVAADTSSVAAALSSATLEISSIALTAFPVLSICMLDRSAMLSAFRSVSMTVWTMV